MTHSTTDITTRAPHHRIAHRVAALAALVAAACGSRDVAPLDEGPEDPAAESIEVRVNPNRFWYHKDQPVRLSATVEDGEGGVLGDAAVLWSVEPVDAATATGEHPDIPDTESFELAREGRIVFTACVPGDDGEPPTICDTVAIRVDDGSPSLEISHPQPGAELDDPDGIAVRGSVADASDARVYVAGRLAELDNLGQFEMTLPARPGLNHVDVAASDGLTPEARVEMDVLWAPAYRPANASGDDPLLLDDGFAVSLGQRLFDGGGEASESTTEDVAQLIALIARHLPVDDLIPDPVVEEPTFELRLPAASLGPADVSIAVTGAGLDLFVRFPELSLTTEGFLEFDDTVLDLEGEVTASVAAAAGIAVSGGGGEPVAIEVVEPWVAVESAQGEFLSEETGAIFRLAESAFRTVIEDQLEASVGDIVQSTLPELLGEALAVLDDLLGERAIELDTGFSAAPIELSLGGELGAFEATHAVRLATSLATQLGVTSDVIHAQTRGVALFDPALEPPRFGPEGELQLGVRLSLINGFLHALWSAGLLEIDLHALLPESIAGLVQGGWVSGQMPPVVRAPRAGEDGAVVLALGQVELEVDLGDDGEAVIGASLETSVDLAVSDGRIGIDTPGGPRIRVWEIDPAPGTIFTPDLIEATLRDQWDTLSEALIGTLAIELPELAVGDQLADLAPELADLVLAIEISEPLRVRGGYLMIGAGLRGALSAITGPLLARAAAE